MSIAAVARAQSPTDALPSTKVQMQAPAAYPASQKTEYNSFDDPFPDPITTGSIPAAARPGDILLPSATDFRVHENAPADGPLMEMPQPADALPIAFSPPDVKTLIGVILLGDETIFGGRLPQAEREAVMALYAGHGYAPLWLREGKPDGAMAWSEAAHAVIQLLRDADAHALSAASYPIPDFDPSNAETQARADIRLSLSAIAYARDARGARLSREKIGALAMPALELPASAEVLAAVSTDGATLAAYHPRSREYQILRAKLAEIRASRRAPKEVPVAHLPHGPTLKVGMRDGRVPLIRARLGLNPLDDEENNNIYDERLAEAIAMFQREHGLPGGGALNRRTLTALASAQPDVSLPTGAEELARLEDAIRINMERWRWFPHELGDRHVLVNIPEQKVRVVEGGSVVHTTLGVIGKPKSPTPVFSDVMEYLVINPSWYLPPSIVKSEILPGLKRDPDYAAKRGYQVIRNGREITVRQPPGERNALGHVKFMFPNDLAIYLHDTPNRSVFGREMRAMSHGCVRVDDPMALAEVILGNGWSKKKLQGMVGGRERTLRLAEPLPIHLTYFTLTVDSGGRLRSLPDIYGYDRQLKTALERLSNT